MIGMQGIEKIIFSPIPKQCTLIVEGDTGTLKTFLICEEAKALVKNNSEAICLHISLKEEAESVRKRIGLTEENDSDRIFILDYDEIIEKNSQSYRDKKADSLQIIRNVIEKFQKTYKERLTMISIDPINAILGDIPNDKIRYNLYHFLCFLADLPTSNWLIMEYPTCGKIQKYAGPCHFLSDGIIELGMMDTQDDIIRYMEIHKLRGVNHSLKRFQISYNKGSLSVLGPAY